MGVLLFQHFRQVSHTSRGLSVTACHDIEELALAEVFHLQCVPLAADKQRSSEKVRMGDVEIEGHHATHRLAGCVKSSLVNLILFAYVLQQADSHLYLVGGAPVILHSPAGILRNQYKGRVLPLVAVRGKLKCGSL